MNNSSEPYVASLHGSKENYLVQFNYMDLGPSITGENYVLIVRDDLSNYSYFFRSLTRMQKTRLMLLFTVVMRLEH